MSNKRKDQLRARIEKEEILRRQAQLQENIVFANQFLQSATQDYPRQLQILQDPNKKKALFGSRRSSKSTIMGLAMVDQALRVPFSKILYIALTQKSCKQTMYDEVLARLKRNYNLPAKMIGDDEMVFDNGSRIYLQGLNANQTQKEKVRGVKASLIVIDEMQSWIQDIKKIIDEILGPAAKDTKATMIIAGTAGDANAKTFWKELTIQNTKANPEAQSSLHPEWQLYRLTWEQNTTIDDITSNRICDNVREGLEEDIKKHPGCDLTDSYRKEWELEWVYNDSAMIYRYSDANLLTSPLCVEFGTGQRIEMPNAIFLATATYILGLDFGSKDETTFVVVGYNLKYSNKLYVIESMGKPGMLASEVAAYVKTLDHHYHFSRMVGDSHALQFFDDLNLTYGLSIEKAQHLGKWGHQQLLNADLQTRSIVFLPGNERLIQQLQSLTWDPKALQNGLFKEWEGQPNDLADAFLYAHNFSRHLWYTAPKPQNLLVNSDDFNQQLTLSLQRRDKPKGVFDGINFALPNGYFPLRRKK